MAFRKKSKANPPPDVLFDPSKVDLVALSPDGTAAQLILINDTPWTGTDAQVDSLLRKVDNYLKFVVEGRMIAMYPQLEGVAWEIVVHDYCSPPDPASAYALQGASEAALRCGGKLVLESHVPPGAGSA